MSPSRSDSMRGAVMRRPASVLTNKVAAPVHDVDDHPGALSVEHIDDWYEDLERDEKYKLARTILCRTNMKIVLESRQQNILDQMLFNNKIELEGEPVANQLASGRCWLFALCNVVRIFTSRKFNLGEFQLSQSYLYFYDHLSKANWFLEQMIELYHEDLNSRTMQFLLTNAPAQDGGQWDMAVALVLEFGLVPQTVYPESWNTSHSDALDGLLTSKLREMALDLQVYMRDKEKGMSQSALVRAARQVKSGMMKEIYRILTICCGTPPKPDQEFTWEFEDKDKKAHKIVTTPREFARVHAGYNVGSTVSILNDPRNPTKQTYTIERLGNVVGGRPLRYLNMPVDFLKKVAIKMIQSNFPVWFGCDVDKSSDTFNGVMDMRLFEYDEAFGTTVKMDKKERLMIYESSMTHAMMFTAVHLDDHGNPVRWRVENSWGKDACNKGFLVMTDDWFSNYVYQIVAPRSFLSHELLDIYDSAPITVLPPWDVLGASRVFPSVLPLVR
ncbi:bleomycin hydrolase [Rhodotorula toruloides]